MILKKILISVGLYYLASPSYALQLGSVNINNEVLESKLSAYFVAEVSVKDFNILNLNNGRLAESFRLRLPMPDNVGSRLSFTADFSYLQSGEPNVIIRGSHLTNFECGFQVDRHTGEGFFYGCTVDGEDISELSNQVESGSQNFFTDNYARFPDLFIPTNAIFVDYWIGEDQAASPRVSKFVYDNIAHNLKEHHEAEHCGLPSSKPSLVLPGKAVFEFYCESGISNFSHGAITFNPHDALDLSQRFDTYDEYLTTQENGENQSNWFSRLFNKR